MLGNWLDALEGGDTPSPEWDLWLWVGDGAIPGRFVQDFTVGAYGYFVDAAGIRVRGVLWWCLREGDVPPELD